MYIAPARCLPLRPTSPGALHATVTAIDVSVYDFAAAVLSVVVVVEVTPAILVLRNSR